MFKGRKLFATLAVTLAAGGALAAAPLANADETGATYKALSDTNALVSTSNAAAIVRIYGIASYWSNWCIDVGDYNDACEYWVALSAFLQPYAVSSL